MLDISDVQEALPPQLKVNVSQQMVDELNQLSNDPEAAKLMRDNFISYTRVMMEGRFKLEDYVAAVVYVSHKMMGHTSRESYIRTFPHRYQTLKAKGTSDKDISSYVSAYNKGKLVNLIMEQTLVPIWILNQHKYQEAINVQADLMTSAKSEKVRSDAANSLLTHLKKPESISKVELNVYTEDNSGMNELKNTLRELAEMQQTLIKNGLTSTKTIAHQNIIDAQLVSES